MTINYKELLDKYKFDKIPKDLNISTVSVCCKLNININIDNIVNYLDLEEFKINELKYCNKSKQYDNNELKPIIYKKKKPTKIFFNQLTLIIYSKFSKKNINVKLFKNGSIQMCGCKDVQDSFNVLDILKAKLSNVKAIMTNNIIIEKPFIENNKDINITDFKVILINSNFKIPFNIEREVLFNILSELKVNCLYEPCKHDCVNIKYNANEIDKNNNKKNISIFVFQSGNIIITGAKDIDIIIKAYNYIKNILKHHIKDIIIAKYPS